MAEPKKEVKIVWRKVAPGSLRAGLERNIARCESLYAMSSRKMLASLSTGKIAETDEILEWMQDFHVLRYLKQAPQDSEGKIITPEATDAEVEEYRVGLKLNISNYEDRYEMTSEQMLDLLSKGHFQENIEIIEWKFDLRDLRVLEEEIPTTGKPMTVTAPSTNFD